jgi:energy-coupling factor transporter ATP-binding protein EcfA2
VRIKAVELAWFRGAADSVTLDTSCKSLVVYGTNGAGKSSFVDAIEYVLHNGKIEHLAHEYSGRRQEKAIPNRRTPQNRQTELRLTFQDDSMLAIQIMPNGTSTSSGGESASMTNWDYRRTVLRQDEVAAFIRDTKGVKYSALLPLLGLHHMEVAAENLRQLARSIEEQSRIAETRGALGQLENVRQAVFGSATDEEVVAKIKELHTHYCPGEPDSREPLPLCEDLTTAIASRVAGSSIDQRRHVILIGAAALDLDGQVGAARDLNAQLVGAVEPLLVEKLEVLQSTASYVEGLTDEEAVTCPACGRLISVLHFREHVESERRRLVRLIDVFEKRKAAFGTLCDTVRDLKAALEKPDVRSWRDALAAGPSGAHLAHLEGINIDSLRGSCGEAELNDIQQRLVPLIHAAAAASREAPADAQQLSAAKQVVDAGKALLRAAELRKALARAEALLSFIRALEAGTRDEIRIQAQAVIDEISAAIRSMWGILHPHGGIENVRLYVPPDTDKAIDIGLTFYGIEQDSPRLTLSEGNRNCLGLCIFLAMAQREAVNDRPVFLDDVVVSLDRDHRGMIVDLLEKEFGDRQVIILTHDREWYTELRQQLDERNWGFKALLPYETPDLGIRWSHKTTTFDDARSHLKDRPDSAGNDARKIMDVELAPIAERLQIRLLYLRGEKNDKRMAHEFLERLIGDGRKCLEKRVGGNYETFTEALDAFVNADRLLLSWGNRGSHSFDLVPAEASKLIDACELAISMFKCVSCGKAVWLTNARASEWMQCQCGQLRWRYGKGS